VSLPDWLAAAASKPLPGVFHSFEGTLHHWGYLAVGAFLFVEDFGVPLPGETMLIAASLYAGAGHLNIWLVVIVGIAAAVLGDNLGYLIGRKGGRGLVERYGKYVFVTPARLDRAEAFFAEHGGKVVTIARFVEGLRQLNGIIAGTMEMPWRRFIVFNAVGATLWVATWAGLGYLAGNHVETVSRYFTFFAVGAAALLVLGGLWHLYRRRRHKAADRGSAMS
jgi:membrane protein DedA with SNARE-associated domain